MPVIRVEIAVCGDSQTGKTSLLSQFCYDGSKQQKQPLPTMYPELHTKRVNIPDSNYQVELVFVDTPSHRLSASLAQRAIAECKFLILVANITDPRTIDGARQFLGFFRDATTIDKPKGIMVLNYAYEGNDQMTEEQTSQMSQQLGMPIVKVSAQSGKDVDVPFMMLAQAAYNLHMKETQK